jgi:RNA polymerase sigma-70 factor (ECF subfamily)
MDDFQTYRPLLFSIAYRMTGSASDAEDIVQDSYLRYRAAPAGEIRSAKSYLSTIVTRLALDRLKSARAQREQYIGPWLPEPVLTVDGTAAQLQAEQRESIDTAFLVLLETLNPQERAVFLLREVFEYEYAEIAKMLGLSVVNARQIFHRAQNRLAERRPRFNVSAEEQQRLVERFLKAAQHGDVGALKELLAEDVVVWSDGGGKVKTALNSILGRERVLRLLTALFGKAPADTRIELAEVNGGPAALVFVDGALQQVLTYAIGAGRILALHSVVNPDKLAYIRRQLDGV